jgi:putative transposase
MKPLSRPHRRNFNITGHAHVLTFSCFHRFKFLQAERTCHWLADSIDVARRQLKFELWAYVFMPEHAHLLIQPREESHDVASIRHAIKHPVGSKAISFLSKEAPGWLPRITRQRGKKTERLFWQSGGGYDRNIDSPRTLAHEIEYIHLNPVRRGLVERAEDWKWSSSGWYAERQSTNGLVPDSIPAEWIT